MSMKRATVLSVAMALVVALSAALAQTPDFSGTWQLERSVVQSGAPPPESTAPGTTSTLARGGGRGVGLESGMGEVGQFRKARPPEFLVITQTAAEFTVEERWKASNESGAYREIATYKLDGTESRNIVPGRGESVTKTSWEGGKLLVKGTLATAGRGGRFGRGSEVNDALSLSADGRVLTFERTTGSRGGASTTTLIFKKATGG